MGKEPAALLLGPVLQQSVTEGPVGGSKLFDVLNHRLEKKASLSTRLFRRDGEV